MRSRGVALSHNRHDFHRRAKVYVQHIFAPSIAYIYSPNAQEAFALLSLVSPVTHDAVQSAALRFLDFGVGPSGKGCVIIRCAALGACVATRERGCRWVDAFWTAQDTSNIVDVTGQCIRILALISSLKTRARQGAGNSFLGGLAAGLVLENGDVYRGTSISRAIGPAVQRAPQLHFMHLYRPRLPSSNKGCHPCRSIRKVEWKNGTRIPLGEDLKHCANARVVKNDEVVGRVHYTYPSLSLWLLLWLCKLCPAQREQLLLFRLKFLRCQPRVLDLVCLFLSILCA